MMLPARSFPKNSHLNLANLWFIVHKTYPYLEDHPGTCKWLGSPPFVSHKKAIESIDN